MGIRFGPESSLLWLYGWLRRAGHHGFKFFEKLRNLTPADDERREKAENVVVRAIDEQATSERFLNYGRPVDGEINAEHQAFAADFTDEIEAPRNSLQASAQFSAALPDVCEQVRFFDNGEKFERGGADQRAAAERGPVHSRRKGRGEFFIGDECAERQPARQRLGDGDDIRRRIESLVGETAPGAAEPALNFVGDQSGIVLGGQRMRGEPEIFTYGADATLTLNGFDHQGADGVVEFGFEVSDIIEADELNAGNERSKRLTIFFRIRDGERAERAAVKGIFERQDARFLACTAGLGFCAGVGASKLERAVHGFGAAVGEESTVEARPFREFARERPLITIVKQIREVDGATRLTANHANKARMRVPKRVDRNAAEEIEILAAPGIVQAASPPMREDDGRALVSVHQVARFFSANARGR